MEMEKKIPGNFKERSWTQRKRKRPGSAAKKKTRREEEVSFDDLGSRFIYF
jgi:hypothetical protein